MLVAQFTRDGRKRLTVKYVPAAPPVLPNITPPILATAGPVPAAAVVAPPVLPNILPPSPVPGADQTSVRAAAEVAGSTVASGVA